MKTSLLILSAVITMLFCQSQAAAQWQNTTVLSTNSTINAFAPLGSRMLEANKTSVVFSDDSGMNWLSVGLGVSAFVQALTVDNTDPSTPYIYAGTKSSGVFRSTDGGMIWTQTSLTDSNVTQLAICGRYLFAGLGNSNFDNNLRHGSLFRSSDHGTTWSRLNSSVLGGYVTSMIVADTNTPSPSIFVETRNGGVLGSTDSGDTWRSMNHGLPGDTAIVALAALDGPHYLFAGTAFTGSDNGLFVSTDRGIIWSASTLPGYIHAFAVRGSEIFAASGSAVFLSTDFGKSWTNVKANITSSRPITALAVNNGYLYAGTFDAIWRRPLTSLLPTAANDTTSVAFDSIGNHSITLAGDSSRSRMHRIDFDNVSTQSLVITSATLSTTSDRFWIANEIPAVPDTVKPNGIFSVFVNFSGDSSGTNYQDTLILSIDHALTSYYVYLDGKSFNARRGVATKAEAPSIALQNYPNPCALSTTVAFESSAGFASVTIVNLLGQEIARLQNGLLTSGQKSFKWDCSKAPAGIYECIVRQSGEVRSKRILLSR